MNNKTTEFEAEITLKQKIIQFFSKELKFLLVMGATLLIITILAFFEVTAQTNGSSYFFEQYEVGQIADITLIAERNIVPTDGSSLGIVKGEKLLKKGFPISADDYERLKLLANTPVKIDYNAYGGTLLFIMLIAVFTFFILSPSLLGRELLLRETVLLSVFFVFNYTMTVFLDNFILFSQPFTSVIIIPSSFSILLIAVLLGQTAAIYFTFILALGVFAATGFSVVPMLFVFFSSFFIARISRRMEKRVQFVFVSAFIALLNMGILLILNFVFRLQNTPLALGLVGIAANGFLSGILALGFLTPLEMLMNTASVFRLMDLSDLNSPIMKKMLLSASGTYNHSMVVATLAESACNAIGANPLLARVGAYYHDIGKLEQPEYFVENQTGGNKHDEINPRLSASVIKRHVRKGIERAHQMHLPDAVTAIISEHHGNGLIAYFYNEAKKLDDQVSPEEFSYMGEPPSSKESAVVMLADTVEAACRTLDKPNVPRLQKFIRQLVMTKYEHHQLDNSNLTFADLDKIQEVFVNTLAGYYHSRIEYQNQKDPDDDEKETAKEES